MIKSNGCIANDGMVGITFRTMVHAAKETVHIDDVVRHFEHICELGGESSIMLGSDFDGIDHYVHGLTHPGQVEHLAEALDKRFSSKQVEQFMTGNALRYLLQNLPQF